MIEELFSYQSSETTDEVLTKGRILAPGERPEEMFDRVTNALFNVEEVFNTPSEEIDELKYRLSQYMRKRAILPGTPTLTNAGRPEYQESALSSCVVVPVDLRRKNEAGEEIKAYYRQNVGSGFNFTLYENPVDLLIWVNQLSAQETATDLYDRYIGNIGILHFSHPKIREFINAKRERNLPHFNISVDVNEAFMEAAIAGQDYKLSDGTIINVGQLLRQMAENAWQNGDPGIIYLERMNKDNPVSEITPYTATAPCAEMGLAPGETCQFGYINLTKFTTPEGIDYDQLKEAVYFLTRVLDNGVELSIGRYPDSKSTEIAHLKRKIGISVCGLADLFLAYDLPYDSEEARKLARDVLAFINYHSKWASVKLAEERGSCRAMQYADRNQYLSGRFLEEKYAPQKTRTVSSEQWLELAQHIRQTGNLRNILTTALPPSGRTSILMGVNPSIEPIFGVSTWLGSGSRTVASRAITGFVIKHSGGYNPQEILNQVVAEESFQRTSLPEKARACLKTAKEISSEDQLRMVADLVGTKGVFDESASKTVTLPNDASVEDVLKIFILAHQLGLKNISVYRDKSLPNQPTKL